MLSRNLFNLSTHFKHRNFYLSLPLKYLATYPEAKNYYKILDLKPSATQEEIKSAFFELSKKYHPDKCCDEYSKNRFIEISEAFSVLSKPDSRREYDTNRKLLVLGLMGDGFQIKYPKPSPELDEVALNAFNDEMRRRWNEHLLKWSRAQGAFELERGISMDPISNTAPSVSPSSVLNMETNLNASLCIFITACFFAWYILK